MHLSLVSLKQCIIKQLVVDLVLHAQFQEITIIILSTPKKESREIPKGE